MENGEDKLTRLVADLRKAVIRLELNRGPRERRRARAAAARPRHLALRRGRRLREHVDADPRHDQGERAQEKQHRHRILGICTNGDQAPVPLSKP